MGNTLCVFTAVTAGLVLVGVISAIVSACSYAGKVYAIRILFPKIGMKERKDEKDGKKQETEI